MFGSWLRMQAVILVSSLCCCFLKTNILITGDGLVEHRNTAAPSPWVIHILCLLQPVLETVVLCGQSQLLFLQRGYLRPQNSHQHQTSAAQHHQKVLRTRGRGAELGFKRFWVWTPVQVRNLLLAPFKSQGGFIFLFLFLYGLMIIIIYFI